MLGSSRKFHTRHKFGKKRRKAQVNNFKAHLLMSSVNEERDRSPADAADAADASLTASPACDVPKPDASPAHPSSKHADEHCAHRHSTTAISSIDGEGIAEAPERADGELGLVGSLATDASQSSGRGHRDTILLTKLELQVRRTKTDSRLQELALTAASKRKLEFLRNDAPAGAAPPEQSEEEASFLIANLGCIGQVLDAMRWSKKKVRVWFMDYGRWEDVSLDSLRHLPNGYERLPGFAIPVTLHGLKKIMVPKDFKFEASFFDAEVVTNSDQQSIRLHNRNDDICLNDMLAVYAECTGDASRIVTTTSEHIFKSELELLFSEDHAISRCAIFVIQCECNMSAHFYASGLSGLDLFCHVQS
ncbi:hypothetical protein MRX96_007911 [Rhipicephalus microplus]